MEIIITRNIKMVPTQKIYRADMICLLAPDGSVGVVKDRYKKPGTTMSAVEFVRHVADSELLEIQKSNV